METVDNEKHLTASAAGGGSDTLAGADLDGRFRVAGGGGTHALLDLTGHGQESLLDIAGVLGRRLEEGNSQAISKLLGDSVLDDLLVRHIALVAYEQLVDAVGGIAVNLLKPLLDVVEGIHVGDIVHDADTVGTTVVRASDGSEAFLASGIPDLELYGLAIEFYRSDFEINTDSGNVRLRIGIVGKPQKKAGLSDTRVSDEEELEEVIVFGIHDDGRGLSESC